MPPEKVILPPDRVGERAVVVQVAVGEPLDTLFSTPVEVLYMVPLLVSVPVLASVPEFIIPTALVVVPVELLVSVPVELLFSVLPE